LDVLSHYKVELKAFNMVSQGNLPTTDTGASNQAYDQFFNYLENGN
jgi:hypothetical protein